MKKLFFGAMALVCATIFVACGDQAASEPSLIGKWVSDTISKNEDKGASAMVSTLEFKADSVMSQDMSVTLVMEEKGMKMVFPFEMGYNGKFSVVGDNIVCVGDSASYRFKMEKDSVKITSDDATTQALAEKLITTMLKSAEEEFGGSTKEVAMKTDTIPFKFEGADVLKIVSDNDTIVLHRQK